MQEANNDAKASQSIAALGARLNDLRGAEKRPESERGRPEKGNPKMAQETQRTHAAAASASGRTTISDAPASASSATKQAPNQALDAHSDYELVLGRGQIASCLFALTVVVAIFAGGAYFAGKLSAMNCVAASNSIPQASAPLHVASVVSGASIATAQSAANAAPKAGAIPSVSNVPSPASSAANATGTMPSKPSAPLQVASVTGRAIATTTTVPAVIANTQVHDSPSAQASSTAAGADAKGSSLLANPQRGALYLQMGAVEKGMALVIAEGLRQHGLASFVAPGPSDRIFRVLVGPFATQDEYKRAKSEVDSLDVGSFARQFEK